MATSPTMDDANESDLPFLEKNQIVLPLHLTFDDPHSDVSDEASSGSSSSRSSGGWPQPAFGRRSAHRPRQWPDQELPRWSSRPPSLSEESDLSSKNSVQNDASQPKLPIPFIMVAFALVALAALYTSRTSVTEAVEHVAELQKNRDLIMNQLTKTEKDFLLLRRQITAMDQMTQNQQLDASGTPPFEDERAQELLNQVANLKGKLGSETSKVDRLRATVQERARNEVREKYGSGSIRVEMELIFPDRVAGPSKFVIEMASVDDMPHSVHTFLEMVSNSLLDGCSFILNALHVLKAAPLPYDGSLATEKARAFTALGLESVSFKEYHENYPHKQYSVGFAADGSPSFYINTEDNSEIHAGDPCFGMIVEGIDAVRRLEAQPVRNGIWFEKRIGIKHARIIKS